MVNRVQVLVPLAVEKPFDYLVPDGLIVQKGDIVRVPFGRKMTHGVVWAEDGGGIAADRLKYVKEKLSVPPLPSELMAFLEWVAHYTLAPLGNVLAMTLPVPAALEPETLISVYILGDRKKLKLTPVRKRVVDVAGQRAFTLAELTRQAGVTPGVVRTLVKIGALKEVMQQPNPTNAPLSLIPNPLPLTPAQAEAAAALCEKITRAYSVTLLEGVTGSGKTEVYFAAIHAALAQHKQALVLVPEIVLTAQLMARFEKRFGFTPTPWHSTLTPAQRRKYWRAIAQGEARLVVGARSALFLPYPDLGLIVVDEEHEAAYKQEDGVIYHGRDMAVARGYVTAIPVALVSATPSLETRVNVRQGRYGFLHLPERHGSATLPRIDIVDVRRQPMKAGVFLSPPLRAALTETLEKGEQALLYLNRRGYAPLTLCRSCGHRFACPHCSAWLVAHKRRGLLQCHHCGYCGHAPEACPACGKPESLVPVGPGVERLEEEARSFLPTARIAAMTSDSIGSAKTAEALIKDILSREIDLVIGTQMVAKGHHFPHLTLVGIVDGDAGLQGGDLRAMEKSWQLLHQVAGRAGRAELKGKALIQTYNPDNPVLRALAEGREEAFLEQEVEMRRQAGMPPFGKLAALILSGKHENAVQQACRTLSAAAPRGDRFRILGPAPAPLSRLRGQYRYRFLVHTPRSANIQKLLQKWLAGVKIPSSIRLKIDVDPYSFT